jgi:L-ascorbate metabolism protein UlaG (beta-lactamase superfamily)
MAVDIRFLAHAAVELKSDDTTVLVDPFITGNPKITVEASELEPTHIFLTHGHQDHYGDTVEIAKRTGATVVAIIVESQTNAKVVILAPGETHSA